MVRTTTRFHVVILALLLAATAAIYAPLRDAPLVYEDANWMPSIQAGDLELTPGPSRILTYETFLWTYRYVNFTPTAWHLTNVAIHLANGVLVYAIAASVLSAPVALGAAGLFLLHPLNSEAVSYVTARSDLLSTFFVLVAVLLVLGAGHWSLRVLGCFVSLVAAASSKEIGMVGIPLVLATVLCLRRTSGSWLTPVVSIIVVVFGATIGAVFGQLQAYLTLGSQFGGSVLSVPEYALLQASMVWKFLAMVFWPAALSVDHDVAVFGPTWMGLSVIGIAGALAIATLAWRRSPVTTWTITWVAIALAPRFIVRTNEFLNEHQMYLAFIGVWIAVSTAAHTSWIALTTADQDFWWLYQDGITLLQRNREGV